MTRKHFNMIADALKDVQAEAHRVDPAEFKARLDTLHATATYLADGFVQDNPRFDRARFMAACGFQ